MAEQETECETTKRTKIAERGLSGKQTTKWKKEGIQIDDKGKERDSEGSLVSEHRLSERIGIRVVNQSKVSRLSELEKEERGEVRADANSQKEGET